MKKLLIFAILAILTLSIVYAPNTEIMPEKQPRVDVKLGNDSLYNESGEKRPVLISAKDADIEKIRERIRIKEAELEKEAEQLAVGEATKERLRLVASIENQNRVRLAVHSLLAMEDLEGIGRNVSKIARNFNNSIQATIRAEEKIQRRSRLRRFFFGGDDDAAEEIEEEVNKNRERIQELNQLKALCNCSAEVKAMIQEQIQNMELEQSRLQNMTVQERSRKGLLGWMFK